LFEGLLGSLKWPVVIGPNSKRSSLQLSGIHSLLFNNWFISIVISAFAFPSSISFAAADESPDGHQ